MALKIHKFDFKGGSIVVFPLSVNEYDETEAIDYGAIAISLGQNGEHDPSGSFGLICNSCNYAARLEDSEEAEQYIKKVSRSKDVLNKTVVTIHPDELVSWYEDYGLDPDDISCNQDVFENIHDNSDMIESLLSLIELTAAAEKSTATKTETQTEKDAKNMNVSAIIERTKKATVTAAEIQAGKAIAVAVVKAVKPRLPMLARGYADHPLFPVLIGVGMVAASEYLPDQKVSGKVKKAADLMLVAAMLDGADKLLDVEGWIDAAFSTLPAGVLDALKTE